MKNLSVSIFSSTSSIRNDKSHHASSVRFHFDPYSAHVTITVPTKLTFNLTFMCPNQGTVFVRTGNERSKALNWWKHEPFYFIVPNNCKRSGSEIRKLWVFKDSDCTSGAKIVTVHLVPESEKQLAPWRSCYIPELLNNDNNNKNGKRWTSIV